MNIVTGYRGVPHITANEQQAFNQGIFGGGNCVLNVGQKFAATLVDALTVTIADGEGVIQGVHFRIAPGDTDTVSISPGTSGYNRIDLICARYTKNPSTGIEDVELVVVEGTPHSYDPVPPTVNSGDILNGDSPVDFPLWRIYIYGLTPYSVTPLFEPTTATMHVYHGQLNVTVTGNTRETINVSNLPSDYSKIMSIIPYGFRPLTSYNTVLNFENVEEIEGEWNITAYSVGSTSQEYIVKYEVFYI